MHVAMNLPIDCPGPSTRTILPSLSVIISPHLYVVVKFLSIKRLPPIGIQSIPSAWKSTHEPRRPCQSSDEQYCDIGQSQSDKHATHVKDGLLRGDDVSLQYGFVVSEQSGDTEF